MRTIIDHTRELNITNFEQLPHGTGCKYLIAIESHIYGEYIAKKWARKMPATTKRGEVVIRF